MSLTKNTSAPHQATQLSTQQNRSKNFLFKLYLRTRIPKKQRRRSDKTQNFAIKMIGCVFSFTFPLSLQYARHVESSSKIFQIPKLPFFRSKMNSKPAPRLAPLTICLKSNSRIGRFCQINLSFYFAALCFIRIIRILIGRREKKTPSWFDCAQNCQHIFSLYNSTSDATLQRPDSAVSFCFASKQKA